MDLIPGPDPLALVLLLRLLTRVHGVKRLFCPDCGLDLALEAKLPVRRLKLASRCPLYARSDSIECY